MPAGTTWPRYISGAVGVFISMLAGSQTVHMIYQPLQDLNDRVEIEKQKIRMANAKLTNPPLDSSDQLGGIAQSSHNHDK